MDESATPVSKPRFPWPVAILCAVCVGAAAWTWMRYSYCWEVTPNELHPTEAEVHRIFTKRGWYTWPYASRYVRLRGTFRRTQLPAKSPPGVPFLEHIYDMGHPHSTVYAALVSGVARPEEGAEVTLAARVVDMDADGGPILHAGASRFHGASITGLVVGVMGVFAFALCLWRWVRARRAAR